MRRVLPISLLTLVLLVPCSVWPGVENYHSQGNVKLAVLSKDGKIIGHKIVRYETYKFQGKWCATWDEVSWNDAGGKVVLGSTHYSTDEGSIANLKVGKNLTTFDLNPLGSTIRVIIRPPEKYSITYDIKAIAAYPEGTEEWIITDEPIYLPSKEVFGIPTAEEKSLKK